MSATGGTTVKVTADRECLARQMPKWVIALICGMLTVALVLNITALLPAVAFLNIEGHMAGPYSILKVIQMLWDGGLYPLVVLVVGFSVLFPPIKVALATMSMFKPMTINGRQRLLNTLGQLGRWSLLDVFVALLLIIVTSKQMVTKTTVSFGLYAFLSAILLSMLSVAILQEINRRLVLKSSPPVRAVRRQPMVQEGGWRVWAVVPLLIVSIAVLMLAVHLPLFKIHQDWFVSYTWSLWTAILELGSKSVGLQVFSAVMYVYLIAAPALLVLVGLLVMLLPLRQRSQRWLYVAMHHIYEWCMLDVFILAFLLYLTEEREFVTLDLKEGSWFLFGSMVVFHAVMFMTVRTVRREAGMTHHRPRSPAPPATDI